MCILHEQSRHPKIKSRAASRLDNNVIFKLLIENIAVLKTCNTNDNYVVYDTEHEQQKSRPASRIHIKQNTQI